MLLKWNYITPFRVIVFLVLFVIVNIVVFMTFSSKKMIPPPKNNHVTKYYLGTKLRMIEFSCSRWILEVFVDDKPISCGETVPLENFSSRPPSVKFSRAKDVSVLVYYLVSIADCTYW